MDSFGAGRTLVGHHDVERWSIWPVFQGLAGGFYRRQLQAKTGAPATDEALNRLVSKRFVNTHHLVLHLEGQVDDQPFPIAIVGRHDKNVFVAGQDFRIDQAGAGYQLGPAHRQALNGFQQDIGQVAVKSAFRLALLSH